MMKDRVVFFVYLPFKSAYNLARLNIFNDYFYCLIKFELAFLPFSFDDALNL